MDILKLLSYATNLFFIVIGSTSGVFIRNLWLIQRKKMPKLDTTSNLIASVASIFFTLIVKFFIAKDAIWTFDIYAGVSFGVGLLSSFGLDVATDPEFLRKALLSKLGDKEEKIEITTKAEEKSEIQTVSEKSSISQNDTPKNIE